LFILDLETERDTIGIIKSIRESAPNGKIVLLSGGEDRERLQEAFTCGVDGVVLKVQPPEVVLAMIETLCAPTPHYVRTDRDGAVGASVGTTLELMAGSETKLSDWLDDLTEREREVIALVKEGLSNKEIAYRLSISDSTVRHHLTSIFDKVGVPNRQKLLIYAHRFHSTSHHGEFSNAVSLRR
jgi:DNA-binding NarL/FixJ family response regulator